MKYKGKSIEVIGSKTLFGKETLWIHILEDDSFAQVLRSDLEEDMPESKHAGMSYVRYIAIAARIKEEMAQKRLLAPYESSLIPLPHQILVQEKSCFSYVGERICNVDFDNQQQLNNNLFTIFHRMENDIQSNLQTIAVKKLRALGFAEQRISRIGIENIRKAKMRRLQAEKEEWTNTFTRGRSVIPDVKLILTVRVDG